jgi:hypothetical protein
VIHLTPPVPLIRFMVCRHNIRWSRGGQASFHSRRDVAGEMI